MAAAQHIVTLDGAQDACRCIADRRLAPPIFGREAERSAVDHLLDAARRGNGGAMMVRGEIGIGKTTLLDYAAERATSDLRVVRVAGVRSESSLQWTALHSLLGSFTDILDRLPLSQASALRRLIDAEGNQPTEGLLVGQGVAALLNLAAKGTPHLVLVDNLQQLDRESIAALAFAARRLGQSAVAMIFAATDTWEFDATGLVELSLQRLDQPGSAALLDDRWDDLAPYVRGHLVTVAQGNPGALIELSASLAPQQRRGAALPGPYRIGDSSFADAIARLPARTQRVLHVLAACDDDNLDLVVDATRRLGLSAVDLEAAEHKRIVTVLDRTIVFTHPLWQVAALESAALHDQRAAHRALAATLRGRGDRLRAAWHMAAATIGVNEAVAASLESATETDHACGRRAIEAYHRAAQLTPVPGTRARRLLRAARAAAEAGEPSLAASFVDDAERCADGASVRACLSWIRSGLAHEADLPQPVKDLVQTAREISERQPATSALLFLKALPIAWSAGDDEFACWLIPPSSDESDNRTLAQVAALIGRLQEGELSTAARLIRRLHSDLLRSPQEYAVNHLDLLWMPEWLGDTQTAAREAADLRAQIWRDGTIGLLPRVQTALAPIGIKVDMTNWSQQRPRRSRRQAARSNPTSSHSSPAS
jgi:hypothetical protein